MTLIKKQKQKPTNKIMHDHLHLYLLPEVQFAEEQIEQVEVAAVEQQVDEAQHGRGTHHRAGQVGKPHHGLDDSHGNKVKARESGDHGVPLHKD